MTLPPCYLETLEGMNFSIHSSAMVRRRWLEYRLLEQDNHCLYCQREIALDDEGRRCAGTYTLSGELRATCDHVIARSRGGADAYDNVVAACERCNSGKGAGTVNEMITAPWFRSLVHTDE